MILKLLEIGVLTSGNTCYNELTKQAITERKPPMKKYTRNVYKVQYTLDGCYLDLRDKMDAFLSGRQNDIVEYKTVVYSDSSNTLKGFAAEVDTSDLITGPFEFMDVEIIKNK